MFFRQKRSGGHVYLQIVENRWEKGCSRQRVIATVGRLDQLRQDGRLDGLLQSGAEFAEAVLVLSAHRRGETPAIAHRRIGPALIFGRLWDELHIGRVIERLLEGRRFELPLERILFLTVLHRLFASGSDRSCVLNWKQHHAIPGVEDIELHQVYRAMAWLGERLPDDQQSGATPFAPRCTKDALEAQGEKLEWAELLGDLEALQYTEVESDGKRFLLRSDLAKTTAAVFRAVGVAISPSVQNTAE
jgi:hypothetical protein